MRASIRKVVELFKNNIQFEGPIYEFGSFQVPGQENLANLRPLFKNYYYVGCDMRKGPGVDQIRDIHATKLLTNTVGVVLCLDTLEHVEDPIRATQEIYRILKPNGIVLMSSVMYYPIHNYPSDYWRFTPEAFKFMMKDFLSVYVDFGGPSRTPPIIIGVGFKGNGQEKGIEILKHYMDTLK